MPALRVVEGPEQGTRVEFSRSISIGRSRECGLRIADEESSRRHAEITIGDEGPVLHDLGSSNGTFANGARITEHALSPGDRFTIGSLVFEFVGDGDEEEAGYGDGEDDGAEDDDIVTGELIEDAPPQPTGQHLEPTEKLAAADFNPGADGGDTLDETPVPESEGDPPPGYTLIDSVRDDEVTTRFHATERGLGRPATVELIKPDHCRDPEAVLDRLRIAARLEHPAAVCIYSAGQHGDRVYVGCEPVSGQSMQRLGGTLSPEEVAEIGAQVAGALAEAHSAGLLHGSLRPSRIVRTNAGHIKLVGLGLPIPGVDEGASSNPGRLAFQPPEQIGGSMPSQAGDVFALGAVLYHTLCGLPPFDAATASAIAESVETGDFIEAQKLKPDAPAELCELINRMLAPHPADRPHSMADCRDRLRELVRPAPAPVKQAVPPAAPVIVRPAAPERSGVSAATILVVILTLLLLTSIFLLGHLGGEQFIRDAAGSLFTPAELGNTTPPAAP
jgi:hypothetical protein